MKKRTIKSLELNKKTISTLDAAELKGGTTVSITCTAGEICIEIFLWTITYKN
ncbi:hypothetical protein C8N46_10276 [Kordia periserrulae]|uniref:Uncharacterized protein n=1 Tax=Kordia periserrulae TaxID=701523 RepID=A0A2T6C2Y1_9FLAO|nr:hypothetical protein [Kordia periserrulae]PTX62680.1 hypothetical protein C8N46_10276 [Kordia periserrulae]